MTEKNKQTEQPEDQSNTISLGDLTLATNNCSMEKLLDYLVWLLQQKPVKDYLNNHQKKKIIGYAG